MTTLLLGCLALPALAWADTLVQGYKSHDSLAPGWIVRLNSDSTVSAAPANDSSKIFGVVIDPGTAPVALSQNSPNQVFIATSGDYDVLISSENGPIADGDYISMSSTNGIGAKATAGQPTILGRATTGFDGKHGVLTSTANYAIGMVMLHISVGSNPSHNQVEINGRLKNLASSVTGRNVTLARLYIAMAVFAATLLGSVGVIWAGVKGGMVSIGRNPLSKHSVLRGLTQVGILGVIIFLIGLTAVYLILKV